MMEVLHLYFIIINSQPLRILSKGDKLNNKTHYTDTWLCTRCHLYLLQDLCLGM